MGQGPTRARQDAGSDTEGGSPLRWGWPRPKILPVKPLLALSVGDPSGIGPEIAPPSVAAVREEARVIVLGHGAVRPDWIPEIDAPASLGSDGVGWIDTGGPARWELGEVQASCGAAALGALRRGHEIALAGEVDALVTGPVNKAAMHAAGEQVEGQTELLSRWSGAERYEMMGFAGSLRVMLATRHVSLRTALDRLTTEHVLDRLLFLGTALRSIGLVDPLVAVAGLNPHAGEGGLFGREEIEVLTPAIEQARAAGMNVVGPVAPDSVFVRGLRGELDAVLALYHDQAFIPLKLAGAHSGVTFIPGLPYRRFSPMHGTAFDIVGKRRPDGQPVADPGNLTEALRVASRITRRIAE